MADTRFILANLRQLLTRLDDHARSMSRTSGAPGRDDPAIRDQSSFIHGLAIVAVRQAMFDVFEAYAPAGSKNWPRHFAPLLRDFDVSSLPIDDSCTALPPKAVPASSGMAVYAGAACFIGIMSCRYAPTAALTEEGWTAPTDGGECASDDGMATASTMVPHLVGRLKTEGVLDDTALPFLDLVSALATGGGIADMVDVVAVWDRRVAAFAKDVASGRAGITSPAA
jgi:hypothetical protein